MRHWARVRSARDAGKGTQMKPARCQVHDAQGSRSRGASPTASVRQVCKGSNWSEHQQGTCCDLPCHLTGKGKQTSQSAEEIHCLRRGLRPAAARAAKVAVAVALGTPAPMLWPREAEAVLEGKYSVLGTWTPWSPEGRTVRSSKASVLVLGLEPDSSLMTVPAVVTGRAVTPWSSSLSSSSLSPRAPPG